MRILIPSDIMLVILLVDEIDLEGSKVDSWKNQFTVVLESVKQTNFVSE